MIDICMPICFGVEEIHPEPGLQNSKVHTNLNDYPIVI
jgi:hypothetical protein